MRPGSLSQIESQVFGFVVGSRIRQDMSRLTATPIRDDFSCEERVQPMTTKLDTIHTSEPAQETTKKTENGLLKAVVDQVRLDCKTESEEYLDETTVPHGGE